MSSFGEKLKQLRKERGWSQDAFAEKVGIHGRHVGKYEIGNVLPNGETLLRIARVLDVSLDYLLLEDHTGTANPAATIRDRELLSYFEKADQIEDQEDRKHLKVLIDAFLKKRQMDEIYEAGRKGQPPLKKAAR